MKATRDFAGSLVPRPGPVCGAWKGRHDGGDREILEALVPADEVSPKTPGENRSLSPDTPHPARRVALIGSTGSIGRSTLAIARETPGFFDIVSLSANRSWETLADQAAEFGVRRLGIGDPEAADDLASALRERGVRDFEIVTGLSGLSQLARDPEVDTVLLSVVGAAGVVPALAAVEAGKRLALANKEALVAAGSLVRAAAKRSGALIVPVDSEHSAIFQCLASGAPSEVRRIVLTASGGPFRTLAAADLERVTPAQALKHPNWDMGGKITIDSATLMNKGLELIEAGWLFDVGPELLDVVVHPQSVIHSMVEFIDGSIVAHLGVPDMRVPISYALSWPHRRSSSDKSLFLDLISKGTLTFERPDYAKFPCLRLAMEAMKEGGLVPAVMNAANEVAVELYMRGKMGFMDIPRVIGGVMEQWRGSGEMFFDTLDELMAADDEARRMAAQIAGGLTGRYPAAS